MRHSIFVFAALAALFVGDLPAQGADAASQPCPISYSHLSMPYKHEGGTSTPMVQLSFVNETGKKIVNARFGLIVIDQDGTESPYSQGLSFKAVADPGKTTASEWKLSMEKVDINRVGETVYLKNLRFEDGATWQDDGSRRCRQEINYAAK